MVELFVAGDPFRRDHPHDVFDILSPLARAGILDRAQIHGRDVSRCYLSDGNAGSQVGNRPITVTLFGLNSQPLRFLKPRGFYLYAAGNSHFSLG